MKSLLLAGALDLFIDCGQLRSDAEIWQQQICTQLTKQYSDVQLTPIKITDTILTKEVALDSKIGELTAGRLSVELTRQLNGQFVHRRYLFSVKANQYLWVAKRKMYKGELIKNSDLIQKRINVAPFVGLKTFFSDSPINKRLNRSINKNGIFFVDYLDEKALVNEREIINLTIVSGVMQIKTKAIALEKANNSGDKIKVRIVDTGAVIEVEIKGREYAYMEI